MRVSYVARKTLPIARQKQHFSLVTFLGSEQTPFVQTHCIYTSPSHAEHVPWKSIRACSWCVHAHCASPEEKKMSQILSFLLQRCCSFCRLKPHFEYWWCLGEINWNSVCWGTHVSVPKGLFSHIQPWFSGLAQGCCHWLEEGHQEEGICPHSPVPTEQGTRVCALIPQEN